MKSKTYVISILLLLLVFIMHVSWGKYEAKWKGTIEEVDGVTVVRYPKEPIYDEEDKNPTIYKFKIVADIGISEAKTKEEEPYQFARIVSIDCDREGNIYVLDDKDCCVKVFNKNGLFLRKMFREGKGPQEISNPYSLKINRFTGNIFVLQEHGFQLKEFSRTGEFIKLYPLPEQFFRYFEFINDVHFMHVAKGRYGEDEYNNFKIVNLENLKIVNEFVPTKRDTMANAYQRFVIRDERIWTCPGDKMVLVGYDFKTGKEDASLSIKERYKKYEIIRGQDWQAIRFYNYAVPIVLNDSLFIWVVSQSFPEQTEETPGEPKSQKVKLYQYTDKGLVKALELPEFFIQLQTTWKNRVIVGDFFGLYPRIKILELSHIS